MAARNEWWREQDEIDRADPSEQVRADLNAIKDQIDDDIYTKLLVWIDRGPEYLRAAQEKIESLADFHRFAWGRIDLPEQGSGEGLDEIV